MPAAILSQDLLGMCLYIGEGNVNINLEDLVRRFESFQEKYDRYFGITDSDLRNLFYWLIIREYGWNKELTQVSLSEIMFDVLRYQDAYFNDEGEHWYGKDYVFPQINTIQFKWTDFSRYPYDKHKIPEKFEMKKKLKDFLSDPKNHTPYAIMDFLPTIQVKEALLFRCSRRGNSGWEKVFSNIWCGKFIKKTSINPSFAVIKNYFFIGWPAPWEFYMVISFGLLILQTFDKS